MLVLVGLLAAFLTSASFVPQVWKTLRTRDTAGISLAMYAIFTAGVGCWLAWGIGAHQLPVILANAVTFVLSATVLAMKIANVLSGKDHP